VDYGKDTRVTLRDSVERMIHDSGAHHITYAPSTLTAGAPGATPMRERKPSNKPPTDAQVLTIPETCDLTRLSRASLYRAMDNKQLRYLKCGTRRLIAREDADAFIASMRVPV